MNKLRGLARTAADLADEEAVRARHVEQAAELMAWVPQTETTKVGDGFPEPSVLWEGPTGVSRAAGDSLVTAKPKPSMASFRRPAVRIAGLKPKLKLALLLMADARMRECEVRG